MESLKDTTTGKDLFESVINSITRSGLSLDKLASITVQQMVLLLSLVNILA